jgi:hypothetical protein
MPMKDGKPIPYQDGGGARTPTNAEVVEAVFILDDPKEPKDSTNRKWAEGVEARATSEQKKSAHKQLDSADPEVDESQVRFQRPKTMPQRPPRPTIGQRMEPGAAGRGMAGGGLIIDELGYENGGMSYSDRDPIKYSKGGAVSGKNFRGSF